MRAVNLLPPDAHRGRGSAASLRGPGAAVVGLLAVALVLVTLYVLASNSVSQRQSQLVGLRQQLDQTRALTARLAAYTKFEQLAQARLQTVRQIASTRFDWQATLSDLSKVVPSNTSLQSLSATVSPSASSGGSSSSSGLRGDITAPAFELQGCTASQDDVARLMSRLRLIRGVTRVTLADSVKSSSGVAGATVSGTAGAGGCPANAPTFDVVVFFQAPPAVAAGPAAAAGSPAASTPGSTVSAP